MPPTLRSRTVLVACLFLVVGAVAGAVAMWIWTVAHGENGEGTGTNLVGAPVETFTISGSLASPVFPGKSEPLDLTITNPNELPLIVLALTVTVKQVDAPRATAQLPCTAEDFIVEQAPTLVNVTIPSKASRSLSALAIDSDTWPKIGLRETETNQNGCKGATLNLEYTATGKLDR